MVTMNDAVRDQLGGLALSLCEMRVMLSDREARIAELEKELAERPPLDDIPTPKA